MNYIFHLSLIMALASYPLFSQPHASLPEDENGKIIFSEVMQAAGVSRNLLYDNAYHYLNSLQETSRGLKKNTLQVTEHEELYLPLQFTVYNEFPIKSPHGRIKYDLTISVKEGRYRYVASNFVFHYLKRNRYGRFVEVNGKSKPLEDPFFKGQQKLWEQHKQTTHKKISDLAQNLKAVMTIPESGPEKEIVKLNSDW